MRVRVRRHTRFAQQNTPSLWYTDKLLQSKTEARLPHRLPLSTPSHAPPRAPPCTRTHTWMHACPHECRRADRSSLPRTHPYTHTPAHTGTHKQALDTARDVGLSRQLPSLHSNPATARAAQALRSLPQTKRLGCAQSPRHHPAADRQTDARKLTTLTRGARARAATASMAVSTACSRNSLTNSAPQRQRASHCRPASVCVCVCECVRACVRVCVRACARACVLGARCKQAHKQLTSCNSSCNSRQPMAANKQHGL